MNISHATFRGVNRFAAMEEPVSLAALVTKDELAAVVDSARKLFPVDIRVTTRDRELLYETRSFEDSEAILSKTIEYNGDIVGRLYCCTNEELAEDPVEALAEHLLAVLGVLVDTAFARNLAASVHETAISESYAELGDRNTRLAAAVERLGQLESLKSNFLATVSHELRTPLTSILGYAEMLNEGIVGPITPEQKQCVETVLSKADHLLQLITGLLDVSLIEARTLRLDEDEVRLRPLLEQVVKMLEPEASKRKISVRLPPDEKYPRAYCDQGKVKQVVLNILANAIKFSPDGSEIEIRIGVGPLAPEDSAQSESPFWKDQLTERFGVRISVIDKGIGVPADQHDAIFEPFYQVDSSPTRIFGGAGLGLSLAKSYVVAHGGFLWVESSPNVEVGSTFVFSMPAVPRDLKSWVKKSVVSKKALPL